MRENELLEELRRLPMRSSAVAELLTVLDDVDASARQVARALERDPSLCLRVLHLANSPYFGLAGTVTNVERAVVALGGSVIRSLAVSTAAGLFGERGDLMPDGFWGHSVAVAAASAIVAQAVGAPAGDTLCAGLLHDVGAALAYRYAPDRHAQCAAQPIDEVLTAEAQAFGGDHSELGAVALDVWHVPAVIVDAVRRHHAADVDAAAGAVTRCVRAGEALARALAGSTGPQLVEPCLELDVALADVGLPGADVDALLRSVDESSGELGALLAA